MISRKLFNALVASFCLTLLTLLTITGAGPVQAHAGYDRSNPPANASLASGKMPERVQVWFTEKLEARFSELSVVDKTGQRVDAGDSKVPAEMPDSLVISLKPNLPDGAYTVIFNNVSAEDGHAVKGSFAFLVGAGELPLSATGSPLALAEQPGQAGSTNLNFFSVSLRWLNYLGGAGLVGALFFALLVWTRAATRAKAGGRMGPQIDSAHILGIQRSELIIWISLGMLLLGWVGWWLYQTATFSDQTIGQLFGMGVATGKPGGAALTDFLFNTRYGNNWFIRLGLIGLAFGLWSVAGSGLNRKNSLTKLVAATGATTGTGTEKTNSDFTGDDNGDKPDSARQVALAAIAQFQARRLWWWLTTACGLGILFTTSLNSHAAGVETWTWLAVGGDWLHLVSTAVWVGGLLALALSLLAALPALLPGTGDRTRLLAALVPTFSQLAILSVMALIVTGTLNAALHLSDATDLLGTAYGLSLTIKVALLVPLMLLAAYNLLVVSPRLRAFAKSKKAGSKEGAGSIAAGTLGSHFRRAVWAEVGLVIVVLLVSAFLTSTAPPKSIASSGVFYQQVEQAGVKIDFAISPATVGDNSFEARLTDKSSGSPISNARLVDLRLEHLGMDMGSPRLELKAIANQPGHYLGQAPLLSMSGDWAATLIVQRDGQDDIRMPIKFKVK